MSDLSSQITDRLPMLSGYARYLTRNAADAEDLVQDCVERAIQRKDQFKAGTNLDAWLKTIMRNIFLNEKRHEKLVRRHADRERLIEVNYSVPSQTDHMELRDVLSAMESLSRDHRCAIQFLCLDQLGYTEAARRMGICKATAKTRLFRARERLRTQLAA